MIGVGLHHTKAGRQEALPTQINSLGEGTPKQILARLREPGLGMRVGRVCDGWDCDSGMGALLVWIPVSRSAFG